MKKPILQKKEHFDYSQCAKYIAFKLGIRDLRDISGKFHGNPDAPYQDFWHFICDHNEVNNPGYINMPWLSDEEMEDWQLKIVKAFDEEFGEGTEYWVCW